MSNDRVQLKSVRDLHSLVEIFRPETGDPDGSVVFKLTTFSYIGGNDASYFGEIPKRKKQISLELFQNKLARIPDEDIYPTLPPHVSTVIPTGEFYIKRPKLSTYDNSRGQDVLAKLLLQEVETMELLKVHPHPHIARYYGCIVNRGRITGIVLDRYHQTLERRLEDRERKFDADLCFRSISSAIGHLHSLGFAHNDLNPMNIMVDQADKSFLIDFGSCQPFGADLITIGTPGWMEDYFMTSEKSHDEFSLAKLQNWLVEMPAGKYKKPSYPNPEMEETSQEPVIA
jgi:serine/threonine protein kinase